MKISRQPVNLILRIIEIIFRRTGKGIVLVVHLFVLTVVLKGTVARPVRKIRLVMALHLNRSLIIEQYLLRHLFLLLLSLLVNVSLLQQLPAQMLQ